LRTLETCAIGSSVGLQRVSIPTVEKRRSRARGDLASSADGSTARGLDRATADTRVCGSWCAIGLAGRDPIRTQSQVLPYWPKPAVYQRCRICSGSVAARLAKGAAGCCYAERVRSRLDSLTSSMARSAGSPGDRQTALQPSAAIKHSSRYRSGRCWRLFLAESASVPLHQPKKKKNKNQPSALVLLGRVLTPKHRECRHRRAPLPHHQQGSSGCGGPLSKPSSAIPPLSDRARPHPDRVTSAARTSPDPAHSNCSPWSLRLRDGHIRALDRPRAA